MRKADQAMYASKQSGKNRFAYFTQEMDERAHRRHRVMNDLQRALDDGHLELYYQLVIEVKTARVAKAEALIRWNHSDAGLIEPSLFIPLAEESGLIGDIGNWVFHQALTQSRRWSGLLGAPFQIGINVSPLQFHLPQQESWLEFMRGEGVPAHLITLEITEGILMQTSSQVSERLMACKEAGMEVAIDDFGTGYSSMAYLKRFDIDYLKIDRSVIRGMVDDSTDRTIAETIIVMAHKLGLKVIAEGVERPEQLDLLAAAGCDFAQGFLFSHPRPAEQFEQMLSSRWASDALDLH
ncbi:putative bifunctional diguanylate cyclase/phosphodiesterase [Aromatoleum sp.]|uniref:putative bifunctional diguanylate cyclase/phosphodiesterase n=1 Tax=Aromatoleum sp. TaxID=2307007 RepID=UPI002FC61E01